MKYEDVDEKTMAQVIELRKSLLMAMIDIKRTIAFFTVQGRELPELENLYESLKDVWAGLFEKFPSKSRKERRNR